MEFDWVLTPGIEAIICLCKIVDSASFVPASAQTNWEEIKDKLFFNYFWRNLKTLISYSWLY